MINTDTELDIFVEIKKAQRMPISGPPFAAPTRKEWMELPKAKGITEADRERGRRLAEEAKMLGYAAKGRKFPPGRPEGSKEERTLCIEDCVERLVADNRAMSVKELFPKADKSIIGDITEGTFRTYVTDARKKYPKKRNSKK